MVNEFFEEVDSKKKRKKKKSRFWAVVLTALILFGGLIYFSTDWALDALIHTRKEVPVPDLHNKTAAEALDILSASNLAIKKAGEETSDSAPPGAVVRQLPSAGGVVREGRVIRVWLSKSEEEISMPNLVGLTLRNAQLLARQSGLMTGGVDNAYSNDYEAGAAMEQKPKTGERVKKGSIISLTVSNGAPPKDVILAPEFRLKKLTELSVWANENDIEVETQDDPDSTFPNGIVTAQTPPPGSSLKRGDTVTVTVSRRKSANDEKFYRLHYEMPQGKKQARLRVVLINKDGDKDVINEMKDPGSKIEAEIPYGDEAKIRIYVNGILVREREVK